MKKVEARICFVDVMECIGLLFVVMYHATTYNFNWLNNNSVLYFSRYFFNTIMATCVPIFFFVNGYLLFGKKLDLKKHIKKTIKFIILTIIWSIIGFMIIMVIEKHSFSIKNIIKNIILLEPIGWINHLWYMGALVCIYFIFPILKNTYDTNKNYFKYFIIICFIFSFGNVFLSRIATVFFDLFFSSSKIIKYNFFSIYNPFRGIYGYSFAYFCIGGLMNEYKNKILKIKNIKFYALLIIIFSCTLLFLEGIYFSKISRSMYDVVWKNYDSIFTLFNLLAIFVLCNSYKGNVKALEIISNNTLGIYFVHNIFVHVTKKYVIEYPFFCTLFGNIIYVVLLIGICLILVLIMKKIPLIRKLV